jgi:hypothetical protein
MAASPEKTRPPNRISQRPLTPARTARGGRLSASVVFIYRVAEGGPAANKGWQIIDRLAFYHFAGLIE